MDYENSFVFGNTPHELVEEYESPPSSATKTYVFRYHKNELKQNHYSCCKFDKKSNMFQQEYCMQVRHGNLLLLINGTGYTPKGSLEKRGGTLQKEDYLLTKVDGRFTFDTITFAKTHLITAGSRGISAVGNYRNELEGSKLTVKEDGSRILEIQVKADTKI